MLVVDFVKSGHVIIKVKFATDATGRQVNDQIMTTILEPKGFNCTMDKTTLQTSRMSLNLV